MGVQIDAARNPCLPLEDHGQLWPVSIHVTTDEAQYQQDLTDCRAVADEVSTGRDAAEGAAGGAVIGGILGAIFGNSGTAGRMAGGGAVIGAAGKAGDAEQEKSQVVKNCMRGRGYRVLN